jgi:hypothetical protein
MENVVSASRRILAASFIQKKKSAARRDGSRPEIPIQELGATAIMIVVIPVVIVVPAMAVFIPPTMPLIPAAFPRLAQFVARVLRLSAVPSVILRSFVEPVVRLGNAPLATIVVIGGRSGRPRECQHA